MINKLLVHKTGYALRSTFIMVSRKASAVMGSMGIQFYTLFALLYAIDGYIRKRPSQVFANR